MNREETISIHELVHDVTGLNAKVNSFESVMQQLASDTLENRQQLGVLINSVSALNDTVKSQGEKLDVARTARTPATTYITSAVLAIALIGGILWPTNNALESLEETDRRLIEITRLLSVKSSENSISQQHIMKDADKIEMRVNRLEDRFLDLNENLTHDH